MARCTGRMSARFRSIFSITVLVGAVGLLLGGAGPASAAPTPVSCTTDNSLNYAGKQFGQADVAKIRTFDCANLRGADLSGVSLVQKSFRKANLTGAMLSGARFGQADMTGANFTGATAENAHFGQATLSGAIFTDAGLAYADLSQVDAFGADFSGADLSNADLVQADLRSAKLDRTTLKGARFTQARLAGTSFRGVVGLPRWDLYVVVGAGALLVVLLLTFMIGFLRRRRQLVHPARLLIPGILGRVLIVFGLHLALGSSLGLISASGPPTIAPCRGPQCVVGVDAGVVGLSCGVLLTVVGSVVAVTAGRWSGRTFGPADLGTIRIPPILVGMSPVHPAAGDPGSYGMPGAAAGWSVNGIAVTPTYVMADYPAPPFDGSPPPPPPVDAEPRNFGPAWPGAAIAHPHTAPPPEPPTAPPPVQPPAAG